MSVRNLNRLFGPRTVAVIGATNRPHSVGETVLRNLIGAHFHGAIFPVNPKYPTLAGLACYARIRDLPVAPDLAVICTPPATVPGLIEELGDCGTKAAVVLTAGLAARAAQGASLQEAVLAQAGPHLLRILGPNCLGLLVPAIGLNASFAHTDALPGKLAFISQSGALVTAMLDWARARGIGFSSFISLGDSADIDAGDMLDYLASDPQTHSILLYLESVRHARKFMSAARAAARNKPVIVIKAARSAAAAPAAASHTGALAGSDAVYDAAFRRAGMLRVNSTDDLFRAAQTLAHRHHPSGEQLLIVTNGGGPGILAVDALIAAGGRLAALPAEAVQQLDRILPANWSRMNPVDLIGDAPVERYVAAFTSLLQFVGDATLLFIHAPTAIVPSQEIASALRPVLAACGRCVLSCWLGADAVAGARHIFAEAGLPCYDTPEDAVAAFMQLVQFQEAQRLLLQVPASVTPAFQPDLEAAKKIIGTVRREGRAMLTEPEAKAVLTAYGIPAVRTVVAAGVDQVAACAREVGFPVAVKLLSPDVTHKSDVGGVVLDIPDEQAARTAALSITERLARLRPGAALHGFSVQAMAHRPQAHELIAGIATDPVFGPVILFGQGGIAVETISDHALALPPLDEFLARDLISRTRVAKLLAGYRGRPPADSGAICRTLTRLSRLIVDFPAIAELDVNPLLADSAGVLALDARMRVTDDAHAPQPAIRPYPQELEETVVWDGVALVVRPIRPADAAAHQAFFASLSPEDIRSRMFVSMRSLSPSQLARFTQIDYDREMAFIACADAPSGHARTLGVARAIADPDNLEAEFAVTIRSDLKHKGLGRLLMSRLIAYCRGRGVRYLVGECLVGNEAMLRLAASLGFEVADSDDPAIARLRLDLTHAMDAAHGRADA